jgi:hypothetical protein
MELAWWQKWLVGIGTIGAMVLIIPLMVWGGSGSLSRAWQALRQYLTGMAILVAVVGGFGVIMAIAEHGIGPIIGMITGR